MKLQRPPATLTAMKINEGYKSFSLQQQAKTRSSLGQSVDWDYMEEAEAEGSSGRRYKGADCYRLLFSRPL